MSDDNDETRYYVTVTVERRFEVMLYPGTRTIWGSELARQMIEEALRLLCADMRQNVSKAHEELVFLASQAEQVLEMEREAGQKPGLVLTAPRAMN